ncbi:MAG: D-aminoacyl-tRNA deacylase [Candidatus Hodarchaeota archaeon]
MEFLIITSSEDEASLNIRNKLLNSSLFSFREVDFTWNDKKIFQFEGFFENKLKNSNLNNNQIYIGLTEERLIFLNSLKLEESEINPDLIIFASRHASKTARPALLTHSTGNWSKETHFGGEPQRLSLTSALLHKSGFLSLIYELNLQDLKNFSLDIEVTHHGPTSLERPLIYMELGSSKEEWIISKAGIVVANAIINCIFQFLQFQEEGTQKIGLGFGGTHYAPNFARLIRTNSIAMSFICPKYFIQDLTKEMVSMMIKNTYESVDYFIIDWKGINSEDKKHLIPILEEFDKPIRKTKEFN